VATSPLGATSSRCENCCPGYSDHVTMALGELLPPRSVPFTFDDPECANTDGHVTSIIRCSAARRRRPRRCSFSSQRICRSNSASPVGSRLIRECTGHALSDVFSHHRVDNQPLVVRGEWCIRSKGNDASRLTTVRAGWQRRAENPQFRRWNTQEVRSQCWLVQPSS
jgi:hypothetical protein